LFVCLFLLDGNSSESPQSKKQKLNLDEKVVATTSKNSVSNPTAKNPISMVLADSSAFGSLRKQERKVARVEEIEDESGDEVDYAPRPTIARPSAIDSVMKKRVFEEGMRNVLSLLMSLPAH
jgi:hypothetical protein